MMFEVASDGTTRMKKKGQWEKNGAWHMPYFFPMVLLHIRKFGDKNIITNSTVNPDYFTCQDCGVKLLSYTALQFPVLTCEKRWLTMRGIVGKKSC
jgi:hypothetical protein